MRTRFTMMTAALLLASATAARAQQPPPIQPTVAPTPEAVPWGTIDFGFRGTNTTGDDARYDRYSDLRDGAATQIQIGHQTDVFSFTASALNIGYRDQSYAGAYSNGRVKVLGSFNSIPLNYSYMASSPWMQASPDVFTLDPLTRLAVQTKVPGIVGVPQNATQLQTASMYRTLADRVDLASLRGVANAGFNFDATRDVALNLSFTSTNRSGTQPWGASFAFNNANEVPMTLDNRTNDVNAGLEWTNTKGMIKVGYTGSFFMNNVKSLTWDNPIRATDTTPVDLSGYSNGNGPAQGRMSMAPDNSYNQVNATALYKLPAHTTINGALAFTRMDQNDTLIPWTINPAVAACATGCMTVSGSTLAYMTFPGLASLPRPTAEARVDGVNGMVNFTTRPNRYFGFTARYRYNDHANKTPGFDATEYVRFDAVPEETGGISEPFDIKQNRVDLNASFSVLPYTSLRVGYGYDGYDRTGRAWASMADNTVRASVDTVGNQYITVRGIYEYTQRRGSGFDQAIISDSGAQPALRFYDEAERNRDRGTLMVIASPVEALNFTFSVAAGKDTYNDPSQQFGLLDNTNTTYTVGADYTVPAGMTVGLQYGRDKYEANQMSRSANPLSSTDLTFNDPTRNWSLNNVEHVNNVNAYVDMPKIIAKTNIRVSYDYSDSDNGFTFGGPYIGTLMGIGQFIPLPNVTNSWHRVTADVQYFFAKKVGIGVGYWYEKFAVNDFNTINLPYQDMPRIDYLGELNTGYGNRPYEGNTAFVRLLYLF